MCVLCDLPIASCNKGRGGDLKVCYMFDLFLALWKRGGGMVQGLRLIVGFDLTVSFRSRGRQEEGTDVPTILQNGLKDLS